MPEQQQTNFHPFFSRLSSRFVGLESEASSFWQFHACGKWRCWRCWRRWRRRSNRKSAQRHSDRLFGRRRRERIRSLGVRRSLHPPLPPRRRRSHNTHPLSGENHFKSLFFMFTSKEFLDAPSHLYMRSCLSVRLSVCSSVCPSVPCFFRR